MGTLSSQLESLKSSLVDHLEHTFDGNIALPRSGDLLLTHRQVAAQDAEAFLAFVRTGQVTDVHMHGLNQAVNGMPPSSIFHLYQALHDFCQTMLDKESIPAATQQIAGFCEAYVDGYAEGRAVRNKFTQTQFVSEAPYILQTGARWLRMAAEISTALGSILNLDELLIEATYLIQKYSGCSSAALVLIDDVDGWATVQARSSVPGGTNYPAGYRVKVGNSSPMGLCIATGVPQVMLNVNHPLVIPETECLTGIRSMLVLPLISHGQIIGAVSLQSEDVVVFDAEDQLRLRLTVDQIANAIENSRLYRELSTYADTLETLVQARTSEILEAKNYIETIINNSPDAILSLDKSGTIKTVNRAFCQLFGYSNDEARGLLVSALIDQRDKGIIETALTSVVDTGHEARCRLIAARKDGSTFDLDAALAPVTRGGSVEAVISNLRDVTDLVRADQLVKASLREKEVLLQEIHHRVKNNLQIVASLISLQASHIHDDTAIQMLRESQTRISAMALIHERLYQSRDLAHIDFGSYLRELTVSLAQTYRRNEQYIMVRVEADAGPLEIETAIPCALVANELVSNAFEHAFTDGREGEVTVAFKHDTDGQASLVVRDNGVGFPAGLDYRNTHSLGLQLVNSLARQLGGAAEMQVDQGTTFTINFKASVTKSRI